MILSKFENIIVKSILEKEMPELLDCLLSLEVRSRKYTGVGCYINFFSKSDIRQSSNYDAVLGTSAYADINNLEHGVGFILYIENGVPEMLEVFSHAGEEIPRSIFEFEFKYI